MSISKVAVYSIFAVFLLWCVLSFKSDASHIHWNVVMQSWPIILGVGALSLVNYLLRAIRWRWYLAKLGHRLPMRFVFLTYIAGFAFTLSPGKIGEMVRGRYYQQYNVPLTHSAAAFFAERLMDLFAMVCLAACGAAYFSSYQFWIWLAVAIVFIGLATLSFSPWQKIDDFIAQQSKLSPKIKTIAQHVIHTILSAKALLTFRLLVAAFLTGVCAWGLEGIGLMQLSYMMPDLHLHLSAALGIYAFAMIVGALSFLPGGLGGTEAVMMALLVAYGYQAPDAILITLLCRLLTLWFAVILGWGAVFTLRYYPAMVKREGL